MIINPPPKTHNLSSAVFFILLLVLSIPLESNAVEVQLLGNLKDVDNKLIYNNASNLYETNRLPCDACCQRNATADACEPMSDNVQDNTAKFGRTCNDTCMKCYKGSCVYQRNGEDQFNQCADANCADYVYGWSGTDCKRYSAATAYSNCDGWGACQSGFSTCSSGDTLASCGSEGCKKVCAQNGNYSDYDNVSEICYVDLAQHSCAANNVCNDMGYCVSNQPKYVFITNDLYDGDMGGISGVDNICKSAANAAGFGNNWVAFISDASTDARNRIPDSIGGYWRLDDTKIANNKAALIGEAHLTNMRMTETYFLQSEAVTWTGSLSDGTKDTVNTCSNWTSSSGSLTGIVGNASNTDGNWLRTSSYNNRVCNTSHRVYCFQN